MHEKFFSQLQVYTKVIRILLKGYLPISLLTPSKIQESLDKVKKAIQITNPDHDIVIKRLHLYYDMKSVTFGIDEDRNLIVPISSFCTAIYSTTAHTVSNRNRASSHHRSK